MTVRNKQGIRKTAIMAALFRTFSSFGCRQSLRSFTNVYSVCPLVFSRSFSSQLLCFCLFLPHLAGRAVQITLAMIISTEFSLQFSSRLGIPLAALKCFECGPVHSKGRVCAGRHLIGSFHLHLKAVIGWSFYRITAATDDGSFSALFQSSWFSDCCRDEKIISTNVTKSVSG